MASTRHIELCSKTTQINDIDVGDLENPSEVVEYIQDIYNFNKKNESKMSGLMIKDYMSSQLNIDERIRKIVVNWLIEIHKKFKLRIETLYLTVHIMDRYLTVTSFSSHAILVIPRNELKLLGITAMLIASKYVDKIKSQPDINSFVCVSYGEYTIHQVLEMEKQILNRFHWNIVASPTPYIFLLRFIKAAKVSTEGKDKENFMIMKKIAYFLAKKGLVSYSVSVKYYPSMISASAVYAARHTLKMSPVWNGTLEAYTGYSESQLMGCVRLLLNFHFTEFDFNSEDEQLKDVLIGITQLQNKDL